MAIIKTTLPIHSLLNNPSKNYDYVDSFKGELMDEKQLIEPIDVAKAFFSTAPNWVSYLMALRNKIVAIFGLKTTNNSVLSPQEQLNNFKGEPNEQLGLFKVFSKTNNEIIMGEDDKHLNFRVSLYLEPSKNEAFKKDLIISTTVEFNNWLGKLYFLPVKPLHQLIVPTMLKAIIKQLN